MSTQMNTHMNTQATINTNYAEIRDRLFLSMLNKSALLPQFGVFPHRLIGDLAILCMIYPSKTDNVQRAIFVTSEMLEQFHISKEQLFSDAYQSSPNIMPVVIDSIESMTAKIIEQHPELARGDADDDLYASVAGIEAGLRLNVITNNQLLMGAAAILYPGVLKGVAKGRNLFLIPSSVHEFLYLPDNGLMNPMAIENMIQDINRSEVSLHDRLSDHLYYYDCAADEIRLAS